MRTRKERIEINWILFFHFSQNETNESTEKSIKIDNNEKTCFYARMPSLRRSIIYGHGKSTVSGNKKSWNKNEIQNRRKWSRKKFRRQNTTIYRLCFHSIPYIICRFIFDFDSLVPSLCLCWTLLVRFAVDGFPCIDSIQSKKIFSFINRLSETIREQINYFDFRFFMLFFFFWAHALVRIHNTESNNGLLHFCFQSI